MAYLTLDDFKKMGGTADEAAFERYEMKARRLIDRMTHGRIANEDPVRRAVQLCTFELIAAMAAEEAAGGIGGREITAMSNDGVSVSYAQQVGGMNARLAGIVRAWLDGEHTESGVHLLYAGVDA